MELWKNLKKGRGSLESLIQWCLDEGLIKGCEQDEDGKYTVTHDIYTFSLEADQVRSFLKSLLVGGKPPGPKRPSQ